MGTGTVGEADAREQLVGARLATVAGLPREPELHAHEIAHGLLARERPPVVLVGVADRPRAECRGRSSAQRGHVHARDADGARRGPVEAGDDPEERRLSGAARPQEDADLPAPYPQRQALQGGDAALGRRVHAEDVLEVDERRHSTASTRPGAGAWKARRVASRTRAAAANPYSATAPTTTSASRSKSSPRSSRRSPRTVSRIPASASPSATRAATTSASSVPCAIGSRRASASSARRESRERTSKGFAARARSTLSERAPSRRRSQTSLSRAAPGRARLTAAASALASPTTACPSTPGKRRTVATTRTTIRSPAICKGSRPRPSAAAAIRRDASTGTGVLSVGWRGRIRVAVVFVSV